MYAALRVTFEGKKEVLELWNSENEGTKFWMGVLTELKNRGVPDILIACMTGFPEAVWAVSPDTYVGCASFTWFAIRPSSSRTRT
jgi:transposase-like protein